VNWFRKGADGKFVWPGYGENSRVLKWICDRLDGEAEARETAIGLVPTADDLDLDGIELSDEAQEILFNVDPVIWTEEARLIPPPYQQFGERLPQALWDEYEALIRRLAHYRHKAARKAALDAERNAAAS